MPVGSTPVGPTPVGPTPVGPTPVGPTPVGPTPVGPVVAELLWRSDRPLPCRDWCAADSSGGMVVARRAAELRDLLESGAISERPGVVPGVGSVRGVALVPPPPDVPPAEPPVLPEPDCATAVPEIAVTIAAVVRNFHMTLLRKRYAAST